jgi:hypothetical protein
MIVKIHSRGVGRGSGPVEYLLGKNGQREGATLDRGDPKEIQNLIDSSPYAQKYTSGVLSFEEADLDRLVKDELMSSFERALLPGLDADQYSCLWVEHRDKGRLELNFVVPNVELQTGKRLQPYYDRADRPRINAWKVEQNAALKLHDPDDPINKRELVTPRTLPKNKQQAAQAITDGLLTLSASGGLTDRNDVLNALEGAGFTITRKTAKSVSIADPDGGRNIRLKGVIYEQNFRFSAGLRAEIEAASTRYRATSQERIREARAVYQKGTEIKRAENHRRYKRPERAPERFGAQNMDLVARDGRFGFAGWMGSDLDRGASDLQPNTGINPTSSQYQGVREQGRKDPVQQMRQSPVRSDRRVRTDISGRIQDSKGVLDDGIRDAAIERIRKLAESTREATQRLCDGLQQLGAHVRHYIERERHVTPASQQLERAGQYLEHSTPAVGKALQHEKSVMRHDRGMDFSR